MKNGMGQTAVLATKKVQVGNDQVKAQVEGELLS